MGCWNYCRQEGEGRGAGEKSPPKLLALQTFLGTGRGEGQGKKGKRGDPPLRLPCICQVFPFPICSGELLWGTVLMVFQNALLLPSLLCLPALPLPLLFWFNTLCLRVAMASPDLDAAHVSYDASDFAVGVRVTKLFEDGNYYDGTVTAMDEPGRYPYSVTFDDGDVESYTLKQLVKQCQVVATKKNKALKPSAVNVKDEKRTSLGKRKGKAPAHDTNDDNGDDDEQRSNSTQRERKQRRISMAKKCPSRNEKPSKNTTTR